MYLEIVYGCREKAEPVSKYLSNGHGQSFALQGISCLHFHGKYVRTPRGMTEWEARGTGEAVGLLLCKVGHGAYRAGSPLAAGKR